MFKNLVLQNRSYRKFHQDIAIAKETLRELVDLARCSASGGNRQPLKYIISCEPDRNDLIFWHIYLARRVREERYPPEGGRPTAYIVILGDKEIRETFTPDHGIAAQTIMLGASERGLGGCMVGTIKREELAQALEIPPRYQILLVLALGKPDENVVLEDVNSDGKTMFYWDGDVRHVPKRPLDDIIVASYAPSKTLSTKH
ncbi:MAG: nitroreductase family protein [Chloroflexi bacterium]|nr:nitroreductase family protein [Chloroflexota bacterium]